MRRAMRGRDRILSSRDSESPARSERPAVFSGYCNGWGARPSAAMTDRIPPLSFPDAFERTLRLSPFARRLAQSRPDLADAFRAAGAPALARADMDAALAAVPPGDEDALARELRRLFPPAYHLADDAEAEAEYQRLMREDLVASRLAALNLVQEHLTRGTPLDDEAMLGMVQSLNGVRLVLGTLIDVGEGEDPSEIPDDHPLVGEHHLYHFLSYLLEVGVQALSE